MYARDGTTFLVNLTRTMCNDVVEIIARFYRVAYYDGRDKNIKTRADDYTK